MCQTTIEWIEQIKAYINRCKDTEWSDDDELHLIAIRGVFIDPSIELGHTTKKQAYQELFNYLCLLEKPPVISEMNDIINIVLKNFSESGYLRAPLPMIDGLEEAIALDDEKNPHYFMQAVKAFKDKYECMPTVKFKEAARAYQKASGG